MTERNARQLAYAGAALIAGLILLFGLLDCLYREASAFHVAFFCLFGVLFLYCRVIPRLLWIAP
jgi:hypothetical protein